MIALTAVTDDDLDVSAHLEAVAHPSAGAQALFIGTVRDHDPEAAGTVTRLDYSAHPDAERILKEIAERFDSPQLRIAVSHRIGSLAVGDNAIVCAVSSAHRDEAFTASRAVVEAVKRELPVWKKQFEADGDSGWVGLS